MTISHTVTPVFAEFLGNSNRRTNRYAVGLPHFPSKARSCSAYFMRILIVTPTYVPTVGGIETYIRSFARELVAMGHSCQIAVVQVGRRKYAHEYVDGIEVHRVPALGFRQIIFFRAFSEKLGEIDLINVNDPHQAFISLHFILNRQIYGNPRLILTTHGGFFHTRQMAWLKQAHFRWIVPKILLGYDRVVCVSQSDFERYLPATHPSRVVLLENGVDLAPFQASAVHRGDRFGFVYFGRIAPNKNVPKLVAVFRYLVGRTMVHLNVIGEGADLSAARALAEGSNQIRFLPFLDPAELEQILRSSRFFVTATLYEGFGLSVVEAMAAGRVVIANDIPVLRKLIDDGINGFLIDFSAPPDIIAQRLLDIVELPEDLLARIASRASDVASGYSWAHRREIISRIFWLGGESA